MASAPFEIKGPLPAPHSNYYRPPTPPGLSYSQSFEAPFYMDEKTKYIHPPTSQPPQQAPPPSFNDATMVSIPADMFDRMFLQVQNQDPATGGRSAKQTFANPTPLSIVGFLLCLSPLSCDLMGWRGAGGNGAASVGAYFFIGGVLMLLGGFLEWVAGNTFPFVVFASFGGFWFSYGATLLPFFNAFGAYSPDPEDLTAGLASKGFNASFGFFMIFMAVLCLIYLVCALRTNLVFVVIFAGLFWGFTLLTTTFWLLADGGAGAGTTLYIAGASLGVSCIAGWYLLLALLLSAVEFPITLPLVDLSGWLRWRRS
ncbi:hypothetical protein AYO20_10868 [Fonsecaea nubica]|uniref:GPR1/FUN34/YaaH-class plasma membrane protein n=1 Tax=Fonsecaea nubica TaxID=856822 RepID=A0A178C1S4_9EURO|nr:hypothetical protein AYO20_10868 [Fonsecaea nubica]OAL23848.1 hypothetical protein AYO20_10868 [Fonsecaea nubica]